MARVARCAGCLEPVILRRVELSIWWPGGGVRLVEFALCGACTAALLDMVDRDVIGAGVQVEIPGLLERER